MKYFMTRAFLFKIKSTTKSFHDEVLSLKMGELKKLFSTTDIVYLYRNMKSFNDTVISLQYANKEVFVILVIFLP